MKVRNSLLALVGVTAISLTAVADGVYQTLPFSQNWTNTALIAANDDWSGVPGVIGYLGDHDLVGAVTGVDPQTVTADVPAVLVDVIANQLTPNTLTNGGVAEFDLADDVVALQGSGTADAPFVKLHISATAQTNLQLSYTLRDVDGSADNSIQAFAAQYRLGGGSWINIPGTFVADASQGPSISGGETPVSAALPAQASGQKNLEIRILTTNAAGSDEWVAIDNISVTGTPFNPAPVAGAWGLAGVALILASAGVIVTRRRGASIA